MRKLFLIPAAILALCNPLEASKGNSDLLAGLGSFEYASDTAWNSSYGFSEQRKPDNSEWFSNPDANGWRYGFKLAEPDDSVAVGWVRKSGSTVDPSKHLVCRIVHGKGLQGSNCQYIALRNLSGSAGTITLSTTLAVDDSKSSRLHTGDSITFQVEKMHLVGYDRLPVYSNASYKLNIQCGNESYTKEVGKTIQEISGTVASGPIPANTRSVSVSVSVTVTGAMGSSEVGMYLDGAHVWVQRSGQRALSAEDIPVSGKRTIKTFRMFYDPKIHDIKEIAENYDYVMLKMDQDYTCIPQLKYYNPNIRILMYATCKVYDWRDSNGTDIYFANSPFGFGFVKQNHPNWLYNDGSNGYAKYIETDRSYLTKVSDPEYQLQWAKTVASKASARKYDGVFIDDVAASTEIRKEGKLIRPAQEAWEFQSFMHAITPILREKDLEVVQNGATLHLSLGDGRAYIDPFWHPDSSPGFLKYKPNKPDQVADTLYQEWAFFKSVGEGEQQRNLYDEVYWKQCLDDMDTVRLWNEATGAKALGDDSKKRYYISVLGNDHPADPAKGINGWLQFGLASYLLGQNEWTVFSWDIRPAYIAPYDFSITEKLGVPLGNHKAYLGDEYVRYRLYQPSGSAGAGGVVVVNAHTRESRVFKIDFNATDELGVLIRAGSEIVLKPHTGRILIRKSG